MLRMWAHREQLALIRAREALARARREEERLREERESRALQRAEAESRRFYREELGLMLAARWALADSEREMRAFLREEALLLAKSKYDVVGSQEPQPEARRMRLRKDELKRQIADKQRAKREQQGMAAEDDLATRVRTEFLRSLQRIKLEAELRRAQGEPLDELAVDATMAKELRAAAEKERRRVEKERRELEERMVTAFVGRLESELAEMASVEKANRAQISLQEASRKLLKCGIWVRAALQKVKRLEAAEKVARKELTEWDEAARRIAEEVDELRPALEKAEREGLAEIRDTRYMSSKVMHSCPQTFDTDNLFAALHVRYFSLIVTRLALDAETISLEKQLRGVTRMVQDVDAEIIDKEASVRRLRAAFVRESRMMMWRSSLCLLLFAKERKKALREAFTEWHLVALKVTRVRNAFSIRAKIALRREEAASRNAEKQPPGSIAVRETLMHRLTNRVMECVNCKTAFSHSSNHSQACAYHPGDYKYACPKTCTRQNSGEATAQGLGVSPKCMAHYAKRWTCCDRTKVLPYGRDGCSRRWHMPPKTDPAVHALTEQRKETREQTAKAREALEERVRRWKALNRRMRAEEADQMREAARADRKLLQQFNPRDYL